MDLIKKLEKNFLFPIVMIPIIIQWIFRVEYKTYISFQIILLLYNLAIIKLFNIKFKDLGFNKNNISIYLFLDILFLLIINVTLALFSTNTKVIISIYVFKNILIFLIVGISEELYFRALLLKSFKYKINDKLKIIIISLVFTSIHYDYDFMGYIIIFLISIFLFYLYIKSGSIYVPILFHTLWDLVNVGFIFSFDGVSTIHTLIALIFTILVTVAVLRFFNKSKISQIKSNV